MNTTTTNPPPKKFTPVSTHLEPESQHDIKSESQQDIKSESQQDIKSESQQDIKSILGGLSDSLSKNGEIIQDMINDFSKSDSRLQDIMENLSKNDTSIQDKFSYLVDNFSYLVDNVDGEMVNKIIESMGPRGEELLRQFNKKGINPVNCLKNKETLEAARKLQTKKSRSQLDTKVILINKARVAKIKQINSKNIHQTVSKLIGCDNPREINCSRLAINDFSSKTIKVWFDPKNKSRNRRASKIVGFAVGGDIVITSSDPESLTIPSLVEIEKLLVKSD